MHKKSARSSFLKSNISFLSQFLRNPKEIGSIIPSSPLLGKTMAGFVPHKDDRFVVELGPGTGPITKALTKIGLNESNLFCLEMSEPMVKHLKKRFPKLNIAQGDASELNLLLGDKAGKVDTIVSSLPLRSIPKEIVDKIVEEMSRCLAKDGTVIQFTYDPRPSRSPLLSKFKRIDSKVVLGNFPPARVDVFAKK
jgi:phosphatidylethanolamine/phosphatidyl-N-methylethanolamine N-methyltransferase